MRPCMPSVIRPACALVSVRTDGVSEPAWISAISVVHLTSSRVYEHSVRAASIACSTKNPIFHPPSSPSRAQSIRIGFLMDIRRALKD